LAFKGEFKKSREYGQHTAKVWAKSLFWIPLATIITWALNNSTEEKSNRYQGTLRDIRDTHFLFDVGGTYVRMPVSYGPQDVLFKGATERILDAMYKKDPEAGRNFARNVLSSALVPILPNSVKTVLELMFDKDMFRWRPIVPEKQAGLPVENQYGLHTTSFARWAGGKAKISPYKIDHAINGILGSAALDAFKIFDVASGAYPDAPERKAPELPLIRRFSLNPYKYGEYLDRFMEKSKEARNKENLYNIRRDAGWPVNLSKEDRDLLNIFIPPQRTMNYLFGKRNNFHEKKDLSPKEKREKIDQVDREIAELARKTMMKYYESTGELIPSGGRR
jgi:hypothetical protein